MRLWLAFHCYFKNLMLAQRRDWICERDHSCLHPPGHNQRVCVCVCLKAATQQYFIMILFYNMVTQGLELKLEKCFRRLKAVDGAKTATLSSKCVSPIIRLIKLWCFSSKWRLIVDKYITLFSCYHSTFTTWLFIGE